MYSFNTFSKFDPFTVVGVKAIFWYLLATYSNFVPNELKNKIYIPIQTSQKMVNISSVLIFGIAFRLKILIFYGETNRILKRIKKLVPKLGFSKILSSEKVQKTKAGIIFNIPI